MKTLFPYALNSPLRDSFDDELPQNTFGEMISGAALRFNVDKLREGYIVAAALLPPISVDQIVRDSAAFLTNPLATIEAFADQSLPSRISLSILMEPQFADFPEIELLQEIATSVKPFLILSLNLQYLMRLFVLNDAYSACC
jgi:hypothetical protein